MWCTRGVFRERTRLIIVLVQVRPSIFTPRGLPPGPEGSLEGRLTAQLSASNNFFDEVESTLLGKLLTARTRFLFFLIRTPSTLVRKMQGVFRANNSLPRMLGFPLYEVLGYVSYENSSDLAFCWLVLW